MIVLGILKFSDFFTLTFNIFSNTKEEKSETFSILVAFFVKIGIAVKPVHNDHPCDPKIVAAVDKWSLIRDDLFNESSICNLNMVVNWWSLQTGGRYSEMVIVSGLHVVLMKN